MTTDQRELRVKLARSFGSRIQAALSRSQFREVIDRNKADSDPLACHEHDFIDANVCMIEAFNEVMGRDIDSASQRDADLTNTAWDMSREADFYE